MNSNLRILLPLSTLPVKSSRLSQIRRPPKRSEWRIHAWTDGEGCASERRGVISNEWDIINALTNKGRSAARVRCADDYRLYGLNRAFRQHRVHGHFLEFQLCAVVDLQHDVVVVYLADLAQHTTGHDHFVAFIQCRY